jgi:hypothetical protein
LEALSPAQQAEILEDEERRKKESCGATVCSFGWAALLDAEGDMTPETQIIFSKEDVIQMGDIIDFIKKDEDTMSRMKSAKAQGFQIRVKHGEEHQKSTSGNKAFAKFPVRMLESWEMGLAINGIPTAIILIYPKNATEAQEKGYIERFDKIRHKTMEDQCRKIKEIGKKAHEAEKRRARIQAEEEKKRSKRAEMEEMESTNASVTTKNSSSDSSESSESEDEEGKEEETTPPRKKQQEKKGGSDDEQRGSKRKSPAPKFSPESRILGGTYTTPTTAARPKAKSANKAPRSSSVGSPTVRADEGEEDESYALTPEQMETEKARLATLTPEQIQMEENDLFAVGVAFEETQIGGKEDETQGGKPMDV